MKTIVVLTDLSKKAVNAAKTALILAKKLQANLLLYNSFINYPAPETCDGSPLIAEDFIEQKNDHNKKLNMLIDELTRLNEYQETNEIQPAINWQLGDDALGLSLWDTIPRERLEMIVMSADYEESADFVFGEDINSIIDRSPCPVFISPSKINIGLIHKVTFATNFENADIAALRYLVKLARLFKYEIEIVHVVDPLKKADEERNGQHAFKNSIPDLGYPEITYKEIKGEDVAGSLRELCKQNRSGLLAMVHHPHSFLMSLFTHSETRKELADQLLPVLVFPSH